MLLDGAWVTDNTDLLGQLRTAGTRYLVDTAAWRFQHISAQQVTKLTALEHAPAAAWSNLTLDDYKRFVAHDLRLQASLGASAYFVPGLMPANKDVDLTDYDKVAASVVEKVCFERPLPAIATVGFHTQGTDIARSRLDQLSGAYSAVYLQATPIDPYRDSASKLSNVVDLAHGHASRRARRHRWTHGCPHCSTASHGDRSSRRGMATGESFQLSAKLRSPGPSKDGGPRKMTSQASRRYIRAIKRSVGPNVLDAIEAVPAANALLRCDSCCRFLVPDDRIRRGREHSLIARVTEAHEVSTLPRSMRIERAERDWSAARRQLTAANRALTDADLAPIDTDYLDNQLTVLRTAAARRQVA